MRRQSTIESAAGVEKELSEVQSPDANIASVQSMYSNESRENLAKDIMNELETVHALIKDDEWYNIPAPIRSTCEGIIAFAKSLSNKII